MTKVVASSSLKLHKLQKLVKNDPHRYRVVVAGRRWGKCIRSGTLIAMADGSYKTVETVLAGDEILTVNEDTYAIEAKRVQHLQDNGIKETLRITTRAGKKLELTPNHPLLANNVWTDAGELKVGDLIAVPKQTVFGNTSMADYEVDFLAIWFAEGDSGGYTNGTPEINQVMNDAARQMNIEFVDAAYGDAKKGLRWRWRGLKLRENAALDLLDRYGLRKTNAKTKVIPDEIFRLPRHQLARFLNLFVACDGCITRRSKNTWSVEIGLVNERMIRQLADLFLKFGIRGQISTKVHSAKSSVTGENFVSHRFIVSDCRSLAIFCRDIGALSKEAKVGEAAIAANASRGNANANAYLPVSHDEYVQHLSYKPVQKGKYGGYNYSAARDLPEELRAGLTSWRKQTPTRISVKRYEDLRPYSDGYFDPLVDGAVAWDEIVVIEPAGEQQTYDLSVEGNHNFIAEGMVTHNSQLSKILLITKAASRSDQIIYYVAPTYNQARSIMWRSIKAAIPRAWITKIHETRMEIWLINGTLIALKGADKPDSMRGVRLDFIVLDEAQDMKEETWEEVLRPTLVDTGGSAVFICTPKSYNWVHDRYAEGQRGDFYNDDRGRRVRNEWKSWQFPTITSPFIPPKEIAAARRNMDPRTFRQEFEASFESMTGRVYYPFDRKIHVGEYPFNPKLRIHIGMDFNIDPMSAVIIQEQPNGEVWIVDEFILPSSNTEETGQEIVRHYFRHLSSMALYPDPAGNNRNQGRGETNLEILRDIGIKNIFFRRKHPPVADRINAVNRLLIDAEGIARLRINQSCRKTIDSFEQTVYREGTSEVNKALWVEHPTDAFGYFAEYCHPVRKLKMLGVSI